MAWRGGQAAAVGAVTLEVPLGEAARARGPVPVSHGDVSRITGGAGSTQEGDPGVAFGEIGRVAPEPCRVRGLGLRLPRTPVWFSIQNTSFFILSKSRHCL